MERAVRARKEESSSPGCGSTRTGSGVMGGTHVCMNGGTSCLKMLERKRIHFVFCHDGARNAGIVGLL
jgi:hypothetical protein